MSTWFSIPFFDGIAPASPPWPDQGLCPCTPLALCSQSPDPVIGSRSISFAMSTPLLIMTKFTPSHRLFIYTQRKKPINSMHTMHGQFRQLWTIPKFLFGDESTSGLETWHGLTQRVTHKFWGWSPEGNMSYKFSKFPIMSLWKNQPWERRCWLFGVRGSCENSDIRENFSIFENRVLNSFKTISRTLAIQTMMHPRGSPFWDSQNLFHQISRHLAI